MCSFFVLFWCGVLSLMLTHFFLNASSRKHFSYFFIFLKGMLSLPGLVLAPLLISFCYIISKKSLIFPVSLKEHNSLLLYSFCPGLVLSISSGLLQALLRHVSEEINFWQKKPFFLVENAMGINSYKRLKKIILVKSISDSWYTSLPWIFSELIIIEAMFNIPGLGLELWNRMKERHLTQAFLVFLSILALFLLCHGIVRITHQWIGRKLESYL